MAHTIETCDECTGLWEEDSDPVVILCPLHAAAPMLLEALKSLLAHTEDCKCATTRPGGKGLMHYEGTEYEQVTVARAAIAAAEGK